MIRTLQKKFVITAMIAVTLLLLVVLGALNIFNAVSNVRQAESLLDELALRDAGPFFSGSSRPGGSAPGSIQPQVREEEREADSGADLPLNPAPYNMPRQHRGFLYEAPDENARMAALYFTVTMDPSCRVTQVDTAHIASISDEEAAEMALQLDLDSESGTCGSFRYKIFSLPDGGFKVVFLDSTMRQTSVLRVALLSLLLGSVSWVLMLLFVMALSRRAIRPIAENMERQRQFVTDAGHELKTPLAVILANLDAMELRSGESKYSRNIRSQALRLSDLVKNLLTLARVDEYSLKDHAELFDLSALCAETFETFREPAEGKEILFQADLDTGLQFRGDRNQIAQLCSILGDNAVKYCPAGGRIQVSLSSEGRRIALIVSNTTEDVPDLDRIFDRFYRAESSRNQKNSGFGIGLSAARSIAEIHHADLQADYDQAQKVIRFTLRLPAA